MPVRAVSFLWAPCLDAPGRFPEEEGGYRSVPPQVTFLRLASLEEAILETRGTDCRHKKPQIRGLWTVSVTRH